MTMTTNSSPSKPSVRDQLDLVEVKPGIKFSRATLREILPTVEVALFFSKLYELSPQQVTNLLRVTHDIDLVEALFGESYLHSEELQDYLVDLAATIPAVERGTVSVGAKAPTGLLLPEVWKSLEIEVAKSIKDVAAKLAGVIGKMPGKQGKMTFESMRVLNAKRGSIGDHRAVIKHERTADNLVILDVSGSMTSGTIRRIIDDVVSLSYTANAHLAIVSNTATSWAPGEYDSEQVLKAAEFGGTHYEALAPLLDQDWDVVVTIADYDSSRGAKMALAHRSGKIEKVLDLSLVNRPTFLAECVGQLATKVEPLLIGSSYNVLT